MGAEAWRSFKNRSVGFSFGYLVPQGGSAKRAGGGRSITSLDIFEVTATPAPMNNDTRVLSTKATTEPEEPDAEPDAEDEDPSATSGEAEKSLAEHVAELAELVAEMKTLIQPYAVRAADETDQGTTRSRSMDPLRVKTDALALEVLSGGESLNQPPARNDAPKPEPQLSADELRERTRELYLSVLSGVDDS